MSRIVNGSFSSSPTLPMAKEDISCYHSNIYHHVAENAANVQLFITKVQMSEYHSLLDQEKWRTWVSLQQYVKGWAWNGVTGARRGVLMWSRWWYWLEQGSPLWAGVHWQGPCSLRNWGLNFYGLISETAGQELQSLTEHCSLCEWIGDSLSMSGVVLFLCLPQFPWRKNKCPILMLSPF